jgi:hypothetical protein
LAGVRRVEGYPQPDLDLPPGDVDVFDQQPQQLLLLGLVELVYHFADLPGEVGDAAAEQVPVGQRGALGGEAVPFGVQVTQAGGDFAGAAVQLGQVDEPGLVEVGQPAPFGCGGVDLAVEAGELGGEQLVVGNRGGDRDGLLAGQQHAGLGERCADLGEDEVVERVGADVAFGAAAVFASGAQRVVVAAVVVAVPGAVAAAHLVAVGADAADPAFDQALEQPFAGFGAARAPLRIVVGDAGGCLELLVGDDAGAADRDPVLARAGDLAGAPDGPRIGDGLGAVEVDPADICLVAQ